MSGPSIDIQYTGPLASVEITTVVVESSVEVTQDGSAASIEVSQAGAASTIEVEQTAPPVAVEVNLAPPGQAPTTWDFYALNWATAPTKIGTTTAGAVYSYTLSTTTRYRLVPSPYAAAQDAFYSAWDGSALSGLIVARG